MYHRLFHSFFYDLQRHLRLKVQELHVVFGDKLHQINELTAKRIHLCRSISRDHQTTYCRLYTQHLQKSLTPKDINIIKEKTSKESRTEKKIDSPSSITFVQVLHEQNR